MLCRRVSWTSGVSKLFNNKSWNCPVKMYKKLPMFDDNTKF